MSAQITAFISIMCASGVLNLFLCLYAYLKRHTYSTIVYFFIAYVGSISFYCFTSAAGLLATNLLEIKIWNALQYIGIALSPALGLLFVLKYVGFNIPKIVVPALLCIPTITIIMVVTNDYHLLHYRVFEADPLLGAPFIYQEEGFWYMIHGIYSFGAMFAAFLLACSRWKETNKVYKPQLATVILGQLIPIVAVFVYLIDLTPRGIDTVPMVLWVTSILYFWSIKSSRLFTMMPIDKDTIFQHINDAVFVLDRSMQLIEFNKASQKIFPQLNQSKLGLNFLFLWKKFTNNYFPFKLEGDALTSEIEVLTDGSTKIYQIRISPLNKIEENNKGHLIIFTDLTEIKLLQQQLERQVYYDEMTQIYNRRAFFKQCEEDFAKAMRHSAPFVIILLDIDYFKHVNDTYGHHVGDEVIIHVVNSIKTQLPKDALFARFGGEEFVISLNGYSRAEGLTLARGLCNFIDSVAFETDNTIISVTISLGVAAATSNSHETLQQLIKKADKALYAAKENGRNKAILFEEPVLPRTLKI